MLIQLRGTQPYPQTVRSLQLANSPLMFSFLKASRERTLFFATIYWNIVANAEKPLRLLFAFARRNRQGRAFSPILFSLVLFIFSRESIKSIAPNHTIKDIKNYTAAKPPIIKFFTIKVKLSKMEN